MKLFILSAAVISLAAALAGCATAPVQPKASTLAVPANSVVASAKPIDIDHKPVIKVCIYSGRVVAIQPNGERNYL